MLHRRKKSHTLRNVLVLLIVLIVVVSVVVAAYQVPGTVFPTYLTVLATSDNAGTPCTFSALWWDSMNLSGYIFGSNNTGTFVNDTWTPFYDFVNQTTAYSRITETVDDNISDVVNWGFWCNGTGNRWSWIPLQTLYVESDKVLLTVDENGTYLGNITIQLFEDEPITTGNFKNLTRIGVYDGTNFTRIAPGFVIQGGDTTNVTDALGNRITIDNITDELPTKHSNTQWTVSMAKTENLTSGAYYPDSSTDQFFINLVDNSAILDQNFTVFGTVTMGTNIVEAISQLVPSSSTYIGYDGSPSVPVTIENATFVN